MNEPGPKFTLGVEEEYLLVDKETRALVIDPPEGHMRTYLDSLERLRGLDVGTVYPAHGPATKDGAKLIGYYLRHRAEREETLTRELALGPASVEELVPRVYADTDARMHGYAARSLLAGLEKLEDEGRAVRDGVRWRSA